LFCYTFLMELLMGIEPMNLILTKDALCRVIWRLKPLVLLDS